MNEEEKKAKLASLPWRSSASLRELYHQCPTPELAAALWEIRRLHEVIQEAFRRFDKGGGEPEYAENMCRYGASSISGEPCIRELLDAAWAKRHEPGSRYYEQRDLPKRPQYSAPHPPSDSRARKPRANEVQEALERGEPPPLPRSIAGTTLRPGNRNIAK